MDSKKEVKRKYIYILSILFATLIFPMISAEGVKISEDDEISGVNIVLPDELNITNVFINNTNHSNSTEYWITDIGTADTINATQFNFASETLSIDESWLEAIGNLLWCSLSGCTMTGPIDMSGNNIINGGTFTADFLVGDGSGLTGVASSGDGTNNSFHVYINGSAYNDIIYNITGGDVDDVEYTIVPGKKFIFGDTYT